MTQGISKKELGAAIRLIRQALKTHGGGLELVAVGKASVKVRLSGACRGCPLAQMTLKNAVERTLLERVPGLKRVTAVN